MEKNGQTARQNERAEEDAREGRGAKLRCVNDCDSSVSFPVILALKVMFFCTCLFIVKTKSLFYSNWFQLSTCRNQILYVVIITCILENHNNPILHLNLKQGQRNFQIHSKIPSDLVSRKLFNSNISLLPLQMMQFPLHLHLLKPILSQRLIQHDRNGV